MAHEFHSHLGLMKGQKFGQKYQLEKYLRRGGEAEIWQAIDTETQEIVAIRILVLKDDEDTRDAQRHFAAEVQILQQLARHPHIISLLDSGWDHGFPYLVMPYIPDGSLATLLADLKRRGQQLPFEDAVLYIQQTLDALIYVHRYGIIHRDVKPANLLRGEHGILLNDWGIALPADVTFPLTRANIGSRPYLAPEQEFGTPVFESDQYAMAITGCEIITGNVPGNGGYEDLQRSYPHIAKVFRQAWDLDATRRFASMQAFAKAFQNAVRAERLSGSTQSMSDPLYSPSRMGRSARPKRSYNRWLIVITILFALSGFGLGAFVWLRSPMTLCIATNLPMTGPDKAAGLGVAHAVQLALAQSVFATSGKGYHGYRIIQHDMDNTSDNTNSPELPDPIQAVRNIHSLFQPDSQPSCPNPIAVIGASESPLAPGEITEATKDNILLLTPASTAPCLTRPDYPDGKDCTYDGRPRPFGRLPGDDIDQGDVIANLLAQQAGKSPNVVIVEDEEIYGVQLAQAAAAQLNYQYGIDPEVDCILADSHLPCSNILVTAKAESFNNSADVGTHIKSEQPAVIFFAGNNAREAVALRKILGHMIPFIVGDALWDSGAFLGSHGLDAENIYATFPAIDPSFFHSPSATPSEKEFYAQYVKQFGGPPQPYSANGYDAANIIIQTIKNMIDAGKQITPGNVAQAVLNNDSGNNDFVGVAGNKIQFDQNGDNIYPQPYTIYRSQQQPQGSWDWKPIVTQPAT